MLAAPAVPSVVLVCAGMAVVPLAGTNTPSECLHATGPRLGAMHVSCSGFRAGIAHAAFTRPIALRLQPCTHTHTALDHMVPLITQQPCTCSVRVSPLLACAGSLSPACTLLYGVVALPQRTAVLPQAVTLHVLRFAVRHAALCCC
jgi:hypothetical protein